MLSGAPTQRATCDLSSTAPERWQSGRSRRTRNAEYVQAYRGFESLPLRQIYQTTICFCYRISQTVWSCPNICPNMVFGSRKKANLVDPCASLLSVTGKRRRLPATRIWTLDPLLDAIGERIESAIEGARRPSLERAGVAEASSDVRYSGPRRPPVIPI